MGANPHANGGLLRRDLVMPNFTDYAVEVTHPGRVDAEATRVMGALLRDVMKQNRDFRLFGPDETASNRLSAVFEATGRAWGARPTRNSAYLVFDTLYGIDTEWKAQPQMIANRPARRCGWRRVRRQNPRP